MQVVLNKPDTQPRDDVEVHGVKPVRLEVVVEGVGVVLCLAEQLTQPVVHSWFVGDSSDEDVEPLEAGFSVSEHIVQVANLVNHGGAVWHNRVQLLEGLCETSGGKMFLMEWTRTTREIKM